MADTRITKKDRFAQMKNIVLDGVFVDAEADLREELVAFIDHEVELLDKRAGTSGKPTKAQIENEKIKVNILAALTGSEDGLRATDVGVLMDIPVQKATALLKQMVDDGTITREMIKKVAMFKVA